MDKRQIERCLEEYLFGYAADSPRIGVLFEAQGLEVCIPLISKGIRIQGSVFR
ncbi:hypothetical protein FHS14_000930 [Paenibacillus baekrokdamisoli]|uniref:hypothetical protein n=1 Tax=Paenibacillus baekrokdamisoli TaxID=1712516 RepID=UPI0013DE88B1|nr:hypothetical protein [Paenibacillus baekrokdamisoli]MBB3067954.1 hypothetical protein [Paenibacillus baekrokdamisoli]